MSTKPEGFDLDALAAETNPLTPFTFQFKGETWTTKHPDDMDWKVVAGLDIRDIHSVLEAYLGEKQYARFAKHDLRSAAADALAKAIDKHYAPGEDDASPAS